MKEAKVGPGPAVQIVDVPFPELPSQQHVIIKVEVAGCNPKDWKLPEWENESYNTGDDMAGTIHTVGSQVKHLFHPGQRVAAFHHMVKPYGSYAEYAIAHASMILRLPDHITFEEAATIPLAAATAAVGLFLDLELPEPWKDGGIDGKRENAAFQPGPLVIYGAAGAVGAFVIKLAKFSGIGPIFCVAGRGAPFVEMLIDREKGDLIVDYREGDDAVVENLQKAAKSLPGSPPIKYGFDAVSGGTSFVNLGKVVSRGGLINVCQPILSEVREKVPRGVEVRRTNCVNVYSQQKKFGIAWFRLFEQGLMDGWLKGHPYQVAPGGLEGLEEALSNLKANKVSASKYVLRISDTPGVGSSKPQSQL